MSFPDSTVQREESQTLTQKRSGECCHQIFLTTIKCIHLKSNCWLYSPILFQKGKPTEAMKELIVHDYGESNALDYIPGAEVLKTSDHVEDQEQSEGKS